MVDKNVGLAPKYQDTNHS